MKIDFAGKVVVVAGGTGDWASGFSCVLEEGAKVVVPYRNDKEFAELQQCGGGT